MLKSRTRTLLLNRIDGQSVGVLAPCNLRSLTDHESDVNRKDHRAWYGLGQAYELLNMHQYSLHYYQRATALRYATLTQRIVFSTQALHSPYDVRIWQAQGMCYEEMGR